MYPLTGMAVGAPLPRPVLSVDLADAAKQSARLRVVNLDTAARTAGAGTLTLAFEPLVKGAADTAIQLGVVGRSLPFTIAVGDTQVRFGDLAAVTLQTGTTAGTISVAVELGGVTDRKTHRHRAGAGEHRVGPGRAQCGVDRDSRERVRQYPHGRGDVYTFYDATGVPLPAITVDNTADFASFFAGSDAGGAFALRAVFPVTGDGRRSPSSR